MDPRLHHPGMTFQPVIPDLIGNPDAAPVKHFFECLNRGAGNQNLWIPFFKGMTDKRVLSFFYPAKGGDPNRRRQETGIHKQQPLDPLSQGDDALVGHSRSDRESSPKVVIPVKTGIHKQQPLDTRFRGGDDKYVRAGGQSFFTWIPVYTTRG